jgi:uncharacterized cupredoxin-like copper-binding protein
MVRKRHLGVIALISVLALLFAACGDDDDSDTAAGDDSGGVTVTTAAGGTAVAVELGENSDTEYFMTAVPDSVPAGPVTFTVENTGTREHEMVVMKTDTAPDQLKPRATDADKVEEEGMVDEVESFKEGLTETITLDLAAGNYVLVCNVAKHYERGMYTAFTVT